MDEYLIPGKSFTRLYNEYKKYGSLVIGFDFDDTIHDYHKLGRTYNNMINLLRDLKSMGCKLICWTAYPDLGYVKDYLTTNHIPFDDINEGSIPLPWKSKKPFFSTILDDRIGLKQVYDELTLLVKLIKEEIE